eukprot:TRINITY_DN20433_c0_g1_i1.p1 TRINITY_DN20433_c0_g1~~TRINITY_DN20433_c0_g1_i1.p1  ORF type:complete len:283 (+),score=36.32 TRINITY_DN20433_c0_g1_i1:131-979(+)
MCIRDRYQRRVRGFWKLAMSRLECCASKGAAPSPQDYGLPLDHPFCPPNHRAPCDVQLRTAKEYEALGGCVRVAAPDAFRTAEEPDPVVATFEDIISHEDCLEIINLARDHMARAQVVDGDGIASEGSQKVEGRTNDSHWLRHDASPAVDRAVTRISELVGIDPHCAEDLQVIRYKPGQQYIKHWDGFHPSDPSCKDVLQDEGNRMVTALLYLSHVEEGGGTGFVNLRFEVSPCPGKLLVFHNCYVDTRATHTDSNHSGLPVVKGEKWACNLWFREQPFRDY